VYSESGFSEKLQKMQIIRASKLYVEKEGRKENLHGQQKGRETKNIVSIGDHKKCPQRDRIVCVVWISQDGKTAEIQCPASHRLTNRPVWKFGSKHVLNLNQTKKRSF